MQDNEKAAWLATDNTRTYGPYLAMRPTWRSHAAGLIDAIYHCYNSHWKAPEERTEELLGYRNQINSYSQNSPLWHGLRELERQISIFTNNPERIEWLYKALAQACYLKAHLIAADYLNDALAYYAKQERAEDRVHWLHHKAAKVVADLPDFCYWTPAQSALLAQIRQGNTADIDTQHKGITELFGFDAIQTLADHMAAQEAKEPGNWVVWGNRPPMQPWEGLAARVSRAYGYPEVMALAALYIELKSYPNYGPAKATQKPAEKKEKAVKPGFIQDALAVAITERFHEGAYKYTALAQHYGPLAGYEAGPKKYQNLANLISKAYKKKVNVPSRPRINAALQWLDRQPKPE